MALFNDSLCVCHPLTVDEKVCAFVVNRYGTRPIAMDTLFISLNLNDIEIHTSVKFMCIVGLSYLFGTKF